MKYLSESSFVDYNDLIRAGITKDKRLSTLFAVIDIYEKNLSPSYYCNQFDVQKSLDPNVSQPIILHESVVRALKSFLKHIEFKLSYSAVKFMPNVVSVCVNHKITNQNIMIINIIQKDEKHIYINTSEKLDINDKYTVYEVIVERMSSDFSNLNITNFERFLAEFLTVNHVPAICNYLANTQLVNLLAQTNEDYFKNRALS